MEPILTVAKTHKDKDGTRYNINFTNVRVGSHSREERNGDANHRCGFDAERVVLRHVLINDSHFASGRGHDLRPCRSVVLRGASASRRNDPSCFSARGARSSREERGGRSAAGADRGGRNARGEDELERRYVPQRLVLSGPAYPRALISSVEADKIAACYAELSPLIENAYRAGESGAFLRIFRGGGPVGRSGSTTFWLSVNGDGSVGRLVPLPLFID